MVLVILQRSKITYTMCIQALPLIKANERRLFMKIKRKKGGLFLVQIRSPSCQTLSCRNGTSWSGKQPGYLSRENFDSFF